MTMTGYDNWKLASPDDLYRFDYPEDKEPEPVTRLKVVTSHEYPPIPIRTFDWCAHLDDYEPPDVNGEGGGPGPVGWGATEAEAIADFYEQLEDEL
jgi:hypothetical protein